MGPTVIRLLALAHVLAAAPLFASASGLRGIGVDEALDAAPQLAPALTAARLAGKSLPLFVRIALDRTSIESAEDAERFRSLDERVQLYRARDVAVFLALSTRESDVTAPESWRRLVRELATRYQGSVGGIQIGPPNRTAETASAHELSFLAKAAAVEARSADPGTAIILDGLAAATPDWRAAFFAEGVAPYIDGYTFDGTGTESADSRIEQLTTLLAREDPEAVIVASGVDLGQDPHEASRRLLRFELTQRTGRVTLTTYSGAPEALGAALRAAASIRDILVDAVVPLDAAAASLQLTQTDGSPGSDGTVPFLLYDTTRFSTLVAYWGQTVTPTRLRLEITESSGRAPVVRDAIGGKVAPVADFVWDKRDGRARMTVPLSGDPMVLDFNFGGDETRAARVEVTETVLPTVGEIISRYQQVQAAQDAVLANYTAAAHMEHHFRPSLTDPGYDVTTDNRFFSGRQGVEWEELSFVFNGSRWGPNRPPFPLLQPEKVLSLPLDLRLNTDYGYELAGTERLGERECYVVRFRPLDDSKPLYRGTVWIDRETFARFRVQAVQTHPGIPVISNEEIQFFALAGSAGGRPVYLLERLVGRQIFLIAGRNLLVEREVRFSDFRINPADFSTLLGAAHERDNIMYRDTDRGIRYLTKRDGERVVSEKSTKTATALAVGIMVDPSYDYPLPIIGINHLDFEFGGKDNQLAVIFGGILALVNLQHPRIAGSRLDASLDLFAIAIKSNDQVFDSDGEREEERLKTRPFSTGINLGWQFTDFQKLSASYQFRWDSYETADSTRADFVAPPSGLTHGFGLAYEYKRRGYSLGGNCYYYRRSKWEPWGSLTDTGYDPEQRGYSKYSLSLSKDFFSGPHKVHLNAAYFGGADLDRFSMYQFGMFDDTKIHGVPSSGVRFPELGMFRASYSFNLFELYRLDLFLEQAMGKDPSGAKRWRSISGVGVGFNLRGPFGTIVRGDLGKSFLPGMYAGAGSFVGQIQFLKPL